MWNGMSAWALGRVGKHTVHWASPELLLMTLTTPADQVKMARFASAGLVCQSVLDIGKFGHVQESNGAPEYQNESQRL